MLQLITGTVVSQVTTGQRHFQRSFLIRSPGREEVAILAIARPAQG
jgi:hypothetical protein